MEVSVENERSAKLAGRLDRVGKCAGLAGIVLMIVNLIPKTEDQANPCTQEARPEGFAETPPTPSTLPKSLG